MLTGFLGFGQGSQAVASDHAKKNLETQKKIIKEVAVGIFVSKVSRK